MLKIRLTRVGKKKQPIFRLVVAEKSMPVKGKFIDLLGFYNPRNKEYKVDKEKAKLWLSKGAKPSETVAMLLRKEGVKLPIEFQTAKKYVRVKKKKKEKEEKQKAAEDSNQLDSKEKENQQETDGNKQVEDKDNKENKE